MSLESTPFSKYYEAHEEEGDFSSIDSNETTYSPSSILAQKKRMVCRWKDIALLLLVTCNTILAIVLWWRFDLMNLRINDDMLRYDRLASPLGTYLPPCLPTYI